MYFILQISAHTLGCQEKQNIHGLAPLIGPGQGPVFSSFIIAQVGVNLVLKIYEVATEPPEKQGVFLLNMTTPQKRRKTLPIPRGG